MSHPFQIGIEHEKTVSSAVHRPRTLLVGTARSATQLAHVLAVAEPVPRLIGCVLPDTATESAERQPGLPCGVLGRLTDLRRIVAQHKPEQVLVMLPLAMQDAIGQAAATLERAGVTWRFLPTLGDQLAGRTTSRITGGLPTKVGLTAGGFVCSPIDPTRLIDRQPRPLDEDALRGLLTDRVVMITGSGGSIGSELTRIVARFGPRKLVLVERSENALFEIDREIARVYPQLERATELHDVTQRDRTFDIVARHRPHAIFHAAAHKHVPMMETHPAQAVENNFYGTRAIADAADAAGVKRFVMISTDKAVNPSSVMGATKRLAERYIQHLSTASSTVFSMVRFGNVLGSACSVVPIWTRQLEHGGPITVTHPDMTRYFMTIPEAAGLVLQAGAQSAGGEVFLLDMGEPIRILDLAERFVRLQGFDPGVDVEIKLIGKRPGEKLFEELAYHGEDMLPTPHDSIRVWKTQPPTGSEVEQTLATFDRLRNKSGDPRRTWRDATPDAIIHALRAAVPEMIHAAAG
ncbi:MAG: polysaccharide biosynthesis protein [Phycisphaerales bacterium JB063]